MFVGCSPCALGLLRRGILLGVALWILVASPHMAWAGAFNLPEGDGLWITDVTFSGGSRYFNGQGRMAPADRFSRTDASAYVEYGVTDWLMAVIRPDLTAVRSTGTRPDTTSVWVRARLARR